MSFSRFRPRSIKTRILYALLGTATLSLICFGLVSFWSMSKLGRSSLEGTTGLSQELLRISKSSLETLAQDGLLKATVDQAALIDAQFRDVENDLIVLVNIAERIWKNPGSYPGGPSYSTDRRPPDPLTASVWQVPAGVPASSVAKELALSSAMDDFMISVLKSNPNLHDCNLATPRGLFRRSPWSDRVDRKFDVRNRSWFKRAIDQGGPGWSEPYAGVITQELRVNCSAPVKKDGEIVAVIGLAVPLTIIQERIIKMRITNQGRAYLVAKNRRILVSEGLMPNRENRGENQTGDYFTFDDQQALPELDRQLASGKPGIMRGVLNKQDCFVAYAPSSTTGWSVLFALPVETVYAPIKTTEQAIITQSRATSSQVYRHIGIAMAVLTVVFLLVLAAVTSLSRRMARQITAPILALEEGATIIGNGNLEHRLQVESGDEIQQLGDTFNRMAEDLARHIHDLTQATASRERMQSELKLATDIQVSLLPRTFPPFPERTDIDLYAMMDPAKEVGGDFYDFFFLDDHRLCLIIGDVSDKGVPAALYMMVAKTLLKSEALRDATPAEILERTNSILALDNQSSMFVTVFCAILDTDNGQLDCANAGHLPPVLQQTDGSTAIHCFTPGFVLGPLPDISYTTERIILQPGELVVLYTDGVNEAINPALEEYGEQRLLACIRNYPGGTPEQIIHAIRSEVRAFANGAPQSDDITMLSLRYLGRQT